MLSLAMLDSMSISAKSRGKSTGRVSSKEHAIFPMRFFHESSTLTVLNLAARWTVELEAHPKHVISAVFSSVVEIWCKS